MRMTPEQFLARIAKQPLEPAYLFLGQEGYRRHECKHALIERALGEAGASGVTEIDLENASLREVLDDARSLSLFSADRVIWVASAEAALPRRWSEATQGEEAGERSDATELGAYLAAPTPGTVIVFECSRYDFGGDDRAKLERVEKFYSAAPATVEFRQFTPESSRFLAQQLAKQHGLRVAGPELAVLLEAVAGDANRIAAEIEKLSLFVGRERAVTMEDLQSLVPNSAQSTIFVLVNALGKRDRTTALRSLDILIREGEYLPLALTILSSHFRLALVVKEARASSSNQVQSLFAKLGVRVWRERAEQIAATAAAFPAERLTEAVGLIYETDKRFRDGYKDDRIVMESLVMALTAPSNVHA
jgi:DNA polymerase III subunit delta